MTKPIKIVQFDLNLNEIFYTYPKSEYSRLPIDSILLKKMTNRISEIEWAQHRHELLRYIHCEMIVHKDTL